MNESQLDHLADEMTQRIADASSTRRMSTPEARYYYQSLVSWLETSLAGLGCDEDGDSETSIGESDANSPDLTAKLGDE